MTNNKNKLFMVFANFTIIYLIVLIPVIFFIKCILIALALLIFWIYIDEIDIFTSKLKNVKFLVGFWLIINVIFLFFLIWYEFKENKVRSHYYISDNVTDQGRLESLIIKYSSLQGILWVLFFISFVYLLIFTIKYFKMKRLSREKL
ncbi:hypothetical protein AMQ84_26260 [Paenibacillus riograndensis]|uniref:Uncharacterized protein n=2 Tax=Paenibacillus riograndensis TaxID=483937 RepID=A0A132TLH8_9BACL|nr:hypothetical protein AMQ84_26260 [Paenibacillus riograndensis]